MDLAGMAAAGERTGVIWTLLEGDDLNANLVRFEAGGGVGEHINDVYPRPIRGIFLPHGTPAAGSAADRTGGTMKRENSPKQRSASEAVTRRWLCCAMSRTPFP